MPPSLSPLAPIGVFDSGIGGLSVLRALQQKMPWEHFIYVADSGYAPYGEKSTAEIFERTSAVSRFLRVDQNCKALVIACNTATAAAANELRCLHPDWPIIGIEPAIKPAARQTQSGVVGVWATRSTLSSERYQDLKRRIQKEHPLLSLQDIACDGLARAIERLAHAPNESESHQFLKPLLSHYAQLLPEKVDTLVLGCTHYPLISDLIQEHIPRQVHLVDPGNRVAEHAFTVLDTLGLLKPAAVHPEMLTLWSSEEKPGLGMATRHWLQAEALPVQHLCV